MRVEDVMTREVVTIAPDASLRDVAATLAGNRISGAPVVDAAGKVVGIVSEADIVVREQGTAERRGGILGWLLEPDAGWQEAKLKARTAGEAMSAPAVVVHQRLPLSRAAKAMTDEGVNRLPVVDDDGRLIGIVTRADLVRSFVRTDGEIWREIHDDVFARQLWASPDGVEILVEHGEVTLRGKVENATVAQAVPALVSRVPGVVSVTSELTT